jgi:hypothetical protein
MWAPCIVSGAALRRRHRCPQTCCTRSPVLKVLSHPHFGATEAVPALAAAKADSQMSMDSYVGGQFRIVRRQGGEVRHGRFAAGAPSRVGFALPYGAGASRKSMKNPFFVNGPIGPGACRACREHRAARVAAGGGGALALFAVFG